MEVYESHLGGIYFTEDIIDPEYLYCDQCGDSDWHLGHAETWEDVIDLITDEYEDGSTWIPYAPEYVDELKTEFEAVVSNEE